jgi:hypothetical protein
VDAIEHRLAGGAKVAGKTEIYGRSAYRLQIDQKGVSDAFSASLPARLRQARWIPGPSGWDSLTLWVDRDTHLPIAARGHSDLPGKGPRDFHVRFLVAERVRFSEDLFEMSPHPGVPVCWYHSDAEPWPGDNPPSGTDGPCNRLAAGR